MNKSRLLKLARHLESGELGHKKFDFSAVNEGPFPRKAKVKGCGTSGCALGEMPIVFPDKWHFLRVEDDDFDPQLKDPANSDEAGIFSGAAAFFDTSLTDTYFLFDPFTGGLYALPPRATKEQVARRIRRFVKFDGKRSQVVDQELRDETDSE